MIRHAIIAILAVALFGCDEMTHQPRYDVYARSKLFTDGKAMQAPPDGTVARDALDGSGEQGQRPAMNLALLQRGQARFEIYCTPCHDQAGYGNGTVPNRGFPHPPSFHLDRLRQAPSQYIVNVITFGHGTMYPFADRVTPQDRWAIASYIRALQLSQNASVGVLSLQDRQALREVGHD